MKTWARVAAGILAACIVTILYVELSSRYTSIHVDLGRNIAQTARDSGGAKFSTRNVAGLVSYSVNNLPQELPARFTRPGFEANFDSLFAVTMYADEENENDLAVTDLVLQFSTDQVTDYRSGQAFIASLIKKFTSKNWTRFIPQFCPAVTGRSTLIRADGKIGRFGVCPLDPDDTMSYAEWQILAVEGLSYEWIGEGILATLRVNTSNDSRGITYRVSIEYENKFIRERREVKTLIEDLASGDSRGWRSTLKYHNNIKDLSAEVKAAEIAALRRGDNIVSRAEN